MKKKKKRRERDLSPVSEERRTSKRRLVKPIEDLSFEDEAFAIAIDPVNAAAPAARPATRASRPVQRGIVIREPEPQEQHAEEEDLDEKSSDGKGKGKKKLQKAPTEPSRDSTPSPLRQRSCRKQIERGSMVIEAKKLGYWYWSFRAKNLFCLSRSGRTICCN